MRLKKLVLMLAALLMIATLAACGGSESPESGQGETERQAGQQAEQQTTQQATPDEQVAPDQGQEDTTGEQAQGPQDKTLRLTVPNMTRVENAVVPTGRGTAEQLFREYTAVHLLGTGYPWEEEANVYIAGHRLGYPNTDSYLAFNDIETLQNGDEVFLEDAEGTTYTYEVFNTVVVEPTNLSVLEPIEGRNIVSLQSCTLPDYSDRIIVQAELTDSSA